MTEVRITRYFLLKGKDSWNGIMKGAMAQAMECNQEEVADLIVSFKRERKVGRMGYGRQAPPNESMKPYAITLATP